MCAGSVKVTTWTTCVLLVVALMTFNLIGLTRDYLANTYDTQVSVTSASTLTFPAVTICNLSPVRRSRWLVLRSRSNTASTAHLVPAPTNAQLPQQSTSQQSPVTSSPVTSPPPTSYDPVLVRKKRASNYCKS